MNCFVYVIWDLSIKTYTSRVILKRPRESITIIADMHLGLKNVPSLLFSRACKINDVQ